ncbi:unnamed protein product [Nippostrongylus brasiliensis]|uniref:glucuronosyltransferase n=1 Tax=Nippostrongylus brasiliensis TaxID=27835 RepID=A0A158R314_NIPBR|nr:unnamed protein product [Nippostrongylus brasiliensis]
MVPIYPILKGWKAWLAGASIDPSTVPVPVAHHPLCYDPYYEMISETFKSVMKTPWDIVILDELFASAQGAMAMQLREKYGTKVATFATTEFSSQFSFYRGFSRNPVTTPNYYTKGYDMMSYDVGNFFGRLKTTRDVIYEQLSRFTFTDFPSHYGVASPQGHDLISVGEHCKEMNEPGHHGTVLICSFLALYLASPLNLMMRIVEAKPLADELRTFVEDPDSKGTIYIAFGSIVITAFFDVINSIDEYRFIFSYGGAEVKNLKPHVKILRWAPQNDILHHHKTVLFFTHGGLKRFASVRQLRVEVERERECEEREKEKENEKEKVKKQSDEKENEKALAVVLVKEKENMEEKIENEKEEERETEEKQSSEKIQMKEKENLKEGVCSDTAMLFLPFFADQCRNALLAKHHGIAEVIYKKNITKEELRTKMYQVLIDEQYTVRTKKVDVTQRDVVRRRLPSNTVERDEQDELEELGGKEFQEIHMNFEEKPKTAPQGNRENAVAHTLPRRAPSRRAKPAQSKSPRRAPSKKGSLARKRKSSKVKARNIASKKKAGSKSVIETKKVGY